MLTRVAIFERCIANGREETFFQQVSVGGV